MGFDRSRPIERVKHFATRQIEHNAGVLWTFVLRRVESKLDRSSERTTDISEMCSCKKREREREKQTDGDLRERERNTMRERERERERSNGKLMSQARRF